MQTEKALRVVLVSLHLHLPTWKSYGLCVNHAQLENTGVKFFLLDRKNSTSRYTVTHQKRQVQEAGCLYYG